ncbi:uncharacterized protein LOC114579170 [Dendrobium catenatum]|uniref:uncharacterized protein LOC114579170 n=1 Tax=Dendrobium catenatum TaxID=906689 RepID=UPI00109F31FE|nr:uncharacterized protein LOC114579170 [Dendrobium catenatum]
MTRSSSEDDSDIVVLRPPSTLPQRGGKMALRARGRGRASLDRRAAPVYIDLEDSDGELENQGAALSLDYQNINTPPKFDLTLDQDSDPEVDISKSKSDEPELTMPDCRLEVKVAPNLNGKFKKVQKFFPGSSSVRDEGDVTLEEAYFNELIELPFGYFPVYVKNTFSKGSIPYRWTKGQARYHENIWQTKIKKNPTSDPFYPLDGLCLETLDDPNDLQVRDAPPEFEEEIKSTVDELREINLRNDDDPRPIFISTLLSEGETQDVIQLLSEFRDCFAWTYDEMPVLAAPVPGKPLILYTVALDESLGALLAQVNDEGKENALYYLNRRLLPIEIRYPSIEKHCLALVFAAQKLRHYMLSHPISLISRVNPLQYLMTQSTLSGRLARWSMILLQFEITFIPLRALKGQAVADFLALHPLPADSPLNDDLPDEQIMRLRESGEAIWELYFDGAASSCRNTTQQSIIPGKAGVGLIFITPEKGMMHFSYHLSEPCTNNEAEYEALITGLELVILMEIKVIKIFGDSQLVINQVIGTYKVLNPNLLKYHQYTLHLLEQIPTVTLYTVPRGSNSAADALAKLAKEFACPEEDSIPIEIQGRKTLSPIDLKHISKSPFQVLSASSTIDEEGDWRQPLIDYI